MAGLVGQIKDLFGDGFRCTDQEFPDFEHLEAKGRQSKGA